jgi:hypothetical protein
MKPPHPGEERVDGDWGGGEKERIGEERRKERRGEEKREEKRGEKRG